MVNTARSIPPFSPSPATPKIGATASPAPLHVVSRGQSRASNDALAWLAVQDVTPGVYDFGVYLAKKVRFATTADGRRKATAGEVMCYPLQKTMAKERGCSVRQIKRLVRSLREVGLEVRQRVRPYGATYVFPVPSDVPSDVPSQREPRTEPRTEKYIRTVGKPTELPPKRADTGQTKQQRLVAAVCDKLGFAVTAAGLEQFDDSPNSDKQKLIARLLRVEARHDRRVSRTKISMGTHTNLSSRKQAAYAAGKPAPAAKKPKKTKGKAKTAAGKPAPAAKKPKKTKGKAKTAAGKPAPAAKKPKKTKGKAKTAGTNVPRTGSRLQREYADRFRSARAGENSPPTTKTPNETRPQDPSSGENSPPASQITPEARAELEADAIEKGWCKRGGKWVKAWL